MCSEIDFLDALWFRQHTRRTQQVITMLYLRAESGVFAADGLRAACVACDCGKTLLLRAVTALVNAGRLAGAPDSLLSGGEVFLRLLPDPAQIAARREYERLKKQTQREKQAEMSPEMTGTNAAKSGQNAPIVPSPVPAPSDNQISDSESDSDLYINHQISDSESESEAFATKAQKGGLNGTLPADLSETGRQLLSEFTAAVIAEAERRMTAKGQPLFKLKYMRLTCRTVKNEQDAKEQQRLAMLVPVQGGSSPVSSPPAPPLVSRPARAAPCEHPPPRELMSSLHDLLDPLKKQLPQTGTG